MDENKCGLTKENLEEKREKIKGNFSHTKPFFTKSLDFSRVSCYIFGSRHDGALFSKACLRSNTLRRLRL